MVVNRISAQGHATLWRLGGHETSPKRKGQTGFCGGQWFELRTYWRRPFLGFLAAR